MFSGCTRVTPPAKKFEPQVFLEMIRFVYLNTCHVDQGNVKAESGGRDDVDDELGSNSKGTQIG